VTAIDTFIQGALIVAQADPTVMDNIDMDEAQRFKGEALGVPGSIIRSSADRDKIRADRAQAQQAAQEQEQQQMMMQQAGDAALKQRGAAA